MAEPKLFPVELLKNYRPAGSFTVIVKADPDDLEAKDVERAPVGSREKVVNGKIDVTATDEFAKVVAGSFIKLPVKEAQNVINSGIAQRADAISLEVEDAA